MSEFLNEPVAFFLLIMSIILVTPLLSERLRLPGMIGIILGGMLILPERIAAAFDGNLVILHFDR